MCLGAPLAVAQNVPPAPPSVPSSSQQAQQAPCDACVKAARASAGGGGATNASFALPEAGSPQRWRLPPSARDGLQATAAMLGSLRHMHDMFVGYTFVQSLLMMAFIVRIISLLVFQVCASGAPLVLRCD